MTDKPEPIDPLTQLAAGAVQLHELFLSFVAAGFSEVQALQLVIALLPKPNQ